MNTIVSENRRGLVGHWKYHGNISALGTWYDVSGNGNNGTLIGNAYVNNNGLNLDGNGDYITVPHNDSFNFGTGDFAISSYVKLISTSTYQHIIGTDTNGCLMIALNQPANNIAIGRHNVAWDMSASYTFTASFTNIVVSRKSGTMSMYANGLQVGSATNTNNYTTTILYLGTHPGNTNLNGTIDDVRIYNRALSSEEISQIYYQTKGLHA